MNPFEEHGGFSELNRMGFCLPVSQKLMFIKSERKKWSRGNLEPFNPSLLFSGFRSLALQGFSC